MTRKIAVRHLVLTVLIAIFAVAPGALSAEDWPQYRGLERDGLSPEKGLLDTWPAEGPKLVWKHKLGQAFSAILISNGRMFTMLSAKHGDKALEYAAAFDPKTGKELWRTAVGDLFVDKDGFGDGPRSTPVVDNNRLYCFGSYGNLMALDVKTGKKVWALDFTKTYKSAVPRWAFSMSPLLMGDLLVVETGGGKGKAFAGIDKKTGKVRWLSQDGAPSYCSPMKIKMNGVEQVLFLNNNTLFSVDAAGKLLWSYKTGIPAPTAMPVFVAPDKFFVSAVSRAGAVMFQVTGTGKDTTFKEVWKSRKLKNHWSSSCYYQGHLYGFDNATLRCLSVETGEVKWTKRGFGKGSLILVDGKLIILSDKGKLVQAKAAPDAFQQTAAFQALNGKSWTNPSFSDGRIYIRNLDEMACYILKK